MPIKFISLNNKFNEKIANYGFESFTIKIEDYQINPNRKTYYVSPANSLCFMDGGIDLSLSRIVFPDIEKRVKSMVRNLDIVNNLGRYYLPIGSSIILSDENINNKFLIVSPTMLLPQNVSQTRNAYYTTCSILYNIIINMGENIDEIDILFTSLCCGYGKMSEDESIKQILEGIRDYKEYMPKFISKNIIINEPNLLEQPKYYQNSEWFFINPVDIIKC